MKALSIVTKLTNLISQHGDSDVVFGFYDEGAFDTFEICEITHDEESERFIIA